MVPSTINLSDYGILIYNDIIEEDLERTDGLAAKLLDLPKFQSFGFRVDKEYGYTERLLGRMCIRLCNCQNVTCFMSSRRKYLLSIDAIIVSTFYSPCFNCTQDIRSSSGLRHPKREYDFPIDQIWKVFLLLFVA